jgi:pilus assembly protein Flp/PilA
MSAREGPHWPGRRAARVRALQKGFGMIRTVKTFLLNEDGATAIEYALIASLIAVFLIGALAALGTNLSSEFAEVGAALK